MADEHHRHAARLQLSDDGEQALDLALGQGRRRLVHDQHPGIDRQRPRDLDQLLLGGAQLLEHLLRTAGQADDVEQVLGPGPHAGVIDAAQPPPGHVAHEDVLEDAEVAEKAGVLVHDGDAATRRFERRPVLDGLALDEHRTGVGSIDARQQLDAGALASTVLPQKREHVTGKQVEGPIRESDGAAEALRGGLQARSRNRPAWQPIGSLPRFSEDPRPPVAHLHGVSPQHY